MQITKILSLSENETKTILAKMYDELSKDSRALNIISTRLKVMNIPEKYSSVNSLSERFSKISENISNVEMMFKYTIMYTLVYSYSFFPKITFLCENISLNTILGH